MQNLISTVRSEISASKAKVYAVTIPLLLLLFIFYVGLGLSGENNPTTYPTMVASKTRDFRKMKPESNAVASLYLRKVVNKPDLENQDVRHQIHWNNQTISQPGKLMTPWVPAGTDLQHSQSAAAASVYHAQNRQYSYATAISDGASLIRYTDKTLPQIMQMVILSSAV